MTLVLKRYQECAFREALTHSDYGYWVLPSGTLLSLTEGMTHGLVVEQYIQQTPDQSAFDTAFSYERQREPDIKKSTFADLWACNTLAWVRVNISQYSDAFNVSWQQRLTERAKETLRMIIDEHDMLDEEIWSDYGTVIGWDGLKAKLENPTYWRTAA